MATSLVTGGCGFVGAAIARIFVVPGPSRARLKAHVTTHGKPNPSWSYANVLSLQTCNSWHT